MPFGSAVGGAEVLLSLQDAGFTSGLSRAEAKLQGFSGNAGKSMGGFQKVAAGAFIAAGAAAVVFAAQSIKSYMDHEAALNRLQTVIKQMPQLIGETSAAFEKQASALQNLTGFQDEEILMADATLARFKLTGDQIRDLIPLVLDYARATGVDVVTASANVGRALLGNTRGLKTLGIAFTSTGDTAKDLIQITKLLEERVGGTAKAFGETAAGKIEIFKGKLDDVKEALGAALVPLLNQLVSVLGHLLPVIIPLIQNIALLAAAFLAFKAVSFLPSMLYSVATGFERIGAAGIAGTFEKAAYGAQAFAGALKGVLPGLGLIAVLGYGLVKTYQQQQESIATLSQTIVKYGSDSKEGAVAVQALALATSRVGDRSAIANRTTAEFKATIAGLDAAHGKLKSSIEAAVVALDKETDASHRTRDALLAQRGATDALAGGILGLVSSARSAHDANVAFHQAQAKVNKLLKEGKEGTQEYRDAYQALGDAQFNALQGQLSFHAALTSYAQTLRGPVAKAQAALTTALNKETSAKYTVEQKTKDVAAATDALTAAQHGLAPAQQKAIALLRDMGAKAGLTKGQIDKMIGSLLRQAGAIDGVTGAWGRVPKRIQTDYFIIQHGYIPGGGGAGNYYGKSAKGGTFRGYEGGATFMGPGGPFRAGEGGYMTLAGTGAEIVGQNGIMPLDMGTFDKIGHSLAKYIGAAGGGGNHYHFHGPVYGWDDFRQKVAQAERANNRERMPL